MRELSVRLLRLERETEGKKDGVITIYTNLLRAKKNLNYLAASSLKQQRREREGDRNGEREDLSKVLVDK